MVTLFVLKRLEKGLKYQVWVHFGDLLHLRDLVSSGKLYHCQSY